MWKDRTRDGVKGVKMTGGGTAGAGMSGGSESLAGLFLSPPQKGVLPGLWISAAADH